MHIRQSPVAYSERDRAYVAAERRLMKAIWELYRAEQEWTKVIDRNVESPFERETVLQSDKVTREAISFSAHPVVIALTDEQAIELLQRDVVKDCNDEW